MRFVFANHIPQKPNFRRIVAYFDEILYKKRSATAVNLANSSVLPKPAPATRERRRPSSENSNLGALKRKKKPPCPVSQRTVHRAVRYVCQKIAIDDAAA
jgi:hypothetical protein